MADLFYFVKQIHSLTGMKLYVNMLAMIVIGLLDGIGILLLIPMIHMSGMIEVDSTGTPISFLFEKLNRVPTNLGLPLLLLIYVVIVISQNILHRYMTIQNTTIQQDFYRQMRVTSYRGLLYANWDFFIKRRKSDLINIMTNEINKAGLGTYSFLQFLSSFIFTWIQISLAFWLSPHITIFVLMFGLGLIYVNRRFLKQSLALGRVNYTLGKSYLAGMTEQINGIKDIKSNTLEHSRMNWFLSITRKMSEQQVNYMKLKTKSQLYYHISSAILIAVFIFIAITYFSAQSGQLMLIIVIFSRLWPIVAGIQGSLEQIATVLPSFKAVKAMQAESNQAVEVIKPVNDNLKPLKVMKRIVLSNVSFRYDKKQSNYALKDIHITIPAHKMTAFVGQSGAGKSTVIDLLMGLNRPETGDILIDGKVLEEGQMMALRQSISYVPQDPFLFHTTIRENLLLVKETASEEMMWEALTFASAAEFVRRLPHGIDTSIGDQGVKLSGGERQRLVLARAILRNPSILILDEATSSLDVENESVIQAAIERLKGRVTIIVIAHRLSTIRNADQVIVLDKGRVIQKGSFALLAEEEKGVFNHLLQKQQ